MSNRECEINWGAENVKGKNGNQKVLMGRIVDTLPKIFSFLILPFLGCDICKSIEWMRKVCVRSINVHCYGNPNVQRTIQITLTLATTFIEWNAQEEIEWKKKRTVLSFSLNVCCNGMKSGVVKPFAKWAFNRIFFWFLCSFQIEQ